MSKSIAVIGLVTYNVWRENDWDRVRNDLVSLMSKDTVDIICLQEAANFHAKLVDFVEETPGWRLIEFKGPSRGGKQNKMIYRTSSIKVNNHKFHDLHESGQAAPDRWLGEAAVEVVEVERTFDLYYTHLHSHVENSRWWRLPRFGDYRRHIRRIRRKVSGGNAAIAVADWNVNFRRSWVNRVPYFPTRAFRKVNMYSNWEILGKPKKGTHHKRLIDAVFLRRVGWMRFTSQKLFSLSSDHRALLVRIAVTR